MAAVGRGAAAAAAVKGGGDRQVRSKVLFVAVGCFLFFLVCLLSARPDAAVVLAHARAGAVRPLQGGSHGLRQQSVEHSNGMAATERRVSDAVIGGERNGDVERDAAPEPAERETSAAAAAAATHNSGEQPAAADADQDKSLQTPAQAAVRTTSTRHQLPGDLTARADTVGQRRPPLCDTSDRRADVCDLAGDVRMVANASALVVVGSGVANGPETYKVRPYARKGDSTSMGRVTEITVRAAAVAPRCTAAHAEPAVVFSIGGYAGNLFHDFTDVLVPLFNAAQRYRGEVRLVVADAAPRWLAKYGALLRALSRHAPLDLAVNGGARGEFLATPLLAVAAAGGGGGEVHCFRGAVVGLRAHRELMIERDRSVDGVGMPDFTRFLRRALSLPRDAPTRTGRKPRLLIVSRRGTRLLLNTDAVVRAAEEVGFEVVVDELVGAAMANDVAAVARLINSFDAMVGVHGADLTNMVFLPPGAAMVQIVPWGGLQWIARMDFGDPAEAMGLRYIQYEIAVHESSLKDKYPRDHEIFTNPTALHKKGFKFMRQTFLKDQDIIVDVERFRAVLLRALEDLTNSR